MHKSIRITGVVVVIVVLALLVAGCARRAPEPGEAVRPVGSTPAPGTLAEAIRACQVVTSYQITHTSAKGDTMTQLMKLEDGKPVRVKLKYAGMWGIIDIAEKTMYSYSPERKALAKMSLEGDAGVESGQILAPTVDGFDSATPITSTETLDGVECWVIEVGPWPQEEKAWIDKKHPLVRQIQRGDKVTKLQYSRINAVPDSEFEIPKDLEVMDAGDMVQQIREMEIMPGIPQKPRRPSQR